MPRKEKQSPPPVPPAPVPSLEAGTEVQPDLAQQGPRFPEAARRPRKQRLVFFLVADGILKNRSVSKLDPATFQSNPGNFLLPLLLSSLGRRPLWFYFKIHLATRKAIWILSFDGRLVGFLDPFQTARLWPLAIWPHHRFKPTQLCCAVIRKQGNC